jgi:hypothetical protein
MPGLAAARGEDFARLFFREIEACAELGTWVSAGLLFARTVDLHADHPYARAIEAKPGRRIGFTRVSEAVRRAEFPHIERRKTGLRRNAPVFFRVRAESRALIPLAPREVLGRAAAAGAPAPDLALLDRALARGQEADAAAAVFARPAFASAFLRAARAFDWQQPTWPERLRAVLIRVMALLGSLRARHARGRLAAG